MNLILHIGHYKTGSTAIQTHFDAHRGAYRDLGWLYPFNGKPAAGKKSHSALPFQMLFEHDRSLPPWYLRTRSFEGYRSGESASAHEMLLEEIGDEAPETVLISSEEFMRFAGRPGVPGEAARALIESFGARRVTVVGVLRRPDRHVESWYNQMVKLGGAPPRLSDNLDRLMRTIHVRFDRAIDYWLEFARPDELVLLSYDEIGHSLIRSFNERVGVPEIDYQDNKENINPRLPDAFVEFMRLRNHEGTSRRRSVETQVQSNLADLATDPEIARTPVYFLDRFDRQKLFDAFVPVNERLGEIAGKPGGFVPDLEGMLEIEPGAISDLDAFNRWESLASHVVSKVLDESGDGQGPDTMLSEAHAAGSNRGGEE